MLSFAFPANTQKRKSICCLFILIACLSSCATAVPNDDNINALAKQYSQLRVRQKALPAGTFDKELRSAGGQLEKVLAELGSQLGKPTYRQEDIIRFMGQPDAIKSAGEYQPHSIAPNEQAGKIPNDAILLIYFWRGWHDYLYFVSQNGVIQSAHWYFAGE